MDAIMAFEKGFEFLSNFFPHRVKYDDIWFNTNEHAFVYAKMRSLGVLKVKRSEKIFKIQHTPRHVEIMPWSMFNDMSPGAAKKIGRKVEPLTPDHLKQWDKKTKFDVMETLTKLKYKDATLRTLLCGTGDRPLIEGNWWKDYIWGAVIHGDRFKGQNNLGEILMKRRRKLQ
jgi:ribA/ribD-fused uncharacterized protein